MSRLTALDPGCVDMRHFVCHVKCMGEWRGRVGRLAPAAEHLGSGVDQLLMAVARKIRGGWENYCSAVQCSASAANN